MNEIAKNSLIAPVEVTATPIPTEREAWLHEMLGTDYEHAEELGLVDQFVYNPETGSDALRHILSGEVIRKQDGTITVAGFHHEPSAGPDTYVDRSHLEGRVNNPSKSRTSGGRPFEPYNAIPVIGGRPKQKLNIDKESGEVSLAPAISSMFPKEYDALAVIKTVVGARDTRDKTKDVITQSGNIRTEGHWLMIDGSTLMKVKLVLQPGTEKIITAMPLTRSYMSLNPLALAVQLGLSEEQPKKLQ